MTGMLRARLGGYDLSSSEDRAGNAQAHMSSGFFQGVRIREGEDRAESPSCRSNHSGGTAAESSGRGVAPFNGYRGLCLHHRLPYITSAGAAFFARRTLRFAAFLRPPLRPAFRRVVFFAALRPPRFLAALRLAGFLFFAVIGMKRLLLRFRVVRLAPPKHQEYEWVELTKQYRRLHRTPAPNRRMHESQCFIVF